MEDLVQLRAESQKALIDFLTKDLELCLTLTRLAQDHADNEDRQQLLKNAR